MVWGPMIGLSFATPIMFNRFSVRAGATVSAGGALIAIAPDVHHADYAEEW